MEFFSVIKNEVNVDCKKKKNVARGNHLKWIKPVSDGQTPSSLTCTSYISYSYITCAYILSSGTKGFMD